VNNLYLDAQFVKAEIAKLIEAYPELSEDETLRTDMIEAETDAHRLIERAFEERQSAETMAGAIKAREIAMAERRGRCERKSDAMKRLIRSVMKAANLDKLTLTEATISITKPRTSVNVTALDELPQGFFKLTRQADKTALKSALEKGETVPGAELAQGEPGITFRTK
jgi:hypothetical protein